MRITNLCNSICLVLLFACSDNEQAGNNRIKFETASDQVTEDGGMVNIKVLFDSPSASASSLYFEVNGTAVLNGDYRIVTPSPVTVNATDQSAVIQIELIDEAIIESAEEIEITLTATGNGLALGADPADNIFLLTIEDNDEAPAEGMQVDLTWTSDDETDIDEFDLNLYLANDVVIEDNQVVSYNFYSKSENEEGFETVLLDNPAPDGEYYIVIVYARGDTDISFTLNLNGAGFSNEAVDGEFKSEEVGTGMFYGPVTKNGNIVNGRIGGS